MYFIMPRSSQLGALWEGEADSWYNSIAGSRRVCQAHSVFPTSFIPFFSWLRSLGATQFPHQGCLHRLGGLVWFGLFLPSGEWNFAGWQKLWGITLQSRESTVGNICIINYKGRDSILFLEVLIRQDARLQSFSFRLCFLSPLHVMDLIIRGRTLLNSVFWCFFSLLYSLTFCERLWEFMPVFPLDIKSTSSSKRAILLLLANSK